MQRNIVTEYLQCCGAGTDPIVAEAARSRIISLAEPETEPYEIV
jgi:hypothetical protein